MEALHPQHVSNALYGISGLFDESVPSTVMIYRYFKSYFNRVVAVDGNRYICPLLCGSYVAHLMKKISMIQYVNSVIS